MTFLDLCWGGGEKEELWFVGAKIPPIEDLEKVEVSLSLAEKFGVQSNLFSSCQIQLSRAFHPCSALKKLQ